MKMPPVTLRGVLHELSQKPSIAQRIARGWMIVGSLFTIVAIVTVIAHFVYDVPIQNKDTGRPATSAEIISVTALFAGGGLLFVVMGFVLRRWSLSTSNGS